VKSEVWLAPKSMTKFMLLSVYQCITNIFQLTENQLTT